MNRLWVRISLTFTLVVIFAIVLPIAIGIAIRFNTGEPLLTREQIQEFRANNPWRENEAPGTTILRNMTQIIITVTVLGIIIGMLSSRGLTAPLSRLAEAARAIGERDLSQRVEVGGTQEIRDVAQAFNEMAAQLQQAEILRQNLLTDVAHELRTPLSVIQGNLQAILDDVYELDKSEIAQLYDQTRQLSRLVDDLRELAQAEARQLPMNMKTVDFMVLFQDVTRIYTPILESADLDLQTHFAKDVPLIWGDRDRLIQCLQNLLNNAIRFTSPGGKITLSMSGDSQGVTIQIKDTGCGIHPDHLPHIFDRFYRTDPARTRETGGSGLGLAITRAILEAHGGTIQAASDGDSEGSTFTIWLPAA
jgi:signal transduction histidine kinase